MNKRCKIRGSAPYPKPSDEHLSHGHGVMFPGESGHAGLRSMVSSYKSGGQGGGAKLTSVFRANLPVGYK
jgi:hypothetical protein